MSASHLATPLPNRRSLRAASNDLVNGAIAWRSWWVLAHNDIRQRYRRSTLGQFWVSISMGAIILGMGIVFAKILKQPIDSYLPYLATGMILWTFLSLVINDLATTFLSSDIYLRSYSGPKSIAIYRAIIRNLLMTAHNLAILPVVWIMFGCPLNTASLLFVPGLALCTLQIALLGLVIAPLSTRFRDLPQIIQNALQLLFFLTPVMYYPAQVEEDFRVLTHYNPLASMLEIMRAPLLGHLPEMHHYAVVMVLILVSCPLAFSFYARFRSRIVFWL